MTPARHGPFLRTLHIILVVTWLTWRGDRVEAVATSFLETRVPVLGELLMSQIKAEESMFPLLSVVTVFRVVRLPMVTMMLTCGKALNSRITVCTVWPSLLL